MQAVSRHSGLIRWSLLICVLLILVLSVATFLLNHSRVHDRIVEHLKTMGVEIRMLHVRLLPTVTIEVSGLLMKDALTSEPTLRADKASLSLRLWPLITKRVAMVTLHAIEPEIVIRRDEHGRWHVPLRTVEQTDSRTGSPRGRWMLTMVELTEGRLRILDENRLEREGIGVHHVQALYETNPAQTHADLMLAAATDDGGELHIAGSLALQKSDQLNSSVAGQFDGTLRFHHWDLAYWLERTGQPLPVHSERTAWRGNISAGLHLEFPADAQGFTAVVSEITTDVGWLLVRGHVMIQSAGTDHPEYAIHLSTSPVRSEALFSNAPPSWVPEHVRVAIVKHQLTGTIELKSVALRGTIDVLRVPDEWHVVAKLTDGSGSWGKTEAVVRNLSATATLETERAEITDISGDVNGVHITSHKVLISDLGLGPTLDAHIMGVGPLEQVMAVLERFSDGTKAHEMLRSVSNITGSLQLGVHLTGPILPKPSLRMISAEMSLQDMGARIARTLSIGQVNGTIGADSHLLGIQQIRGVVQGIHFKAQGRIDMESSPRVNSLHIDLSSDGTAIQELLTAYLPDASNVRIEGPTHSTISLSGSGSAIHCHGTVDVTATEMSVPSLVYKKKGVPGIVEWEGHVLDGKQVIVDRLKLKLPVGELRAAGQVELGQTPKFHFKMQAGPISFHTLAAIGVNTPITEGILETSAVINGEGTNWRLWVPSGWVSIHRAVVALPDRRENLSELSGRLRVTQGGLLLDELSFRMGESDVKVTGMVERWRTHPRATFLVESCQLNVSNFASEKAGDHHTTGSHMQEWMKSKETAITFLVKQLHYERLVLKNVSGEIKVNENNARVDTLRAETPKGALAGHVEAKFGDQDQIELAANMSFDGIPAQQVLLARSEQTEHLQGNLSMNGVLRARIDANSPLQDTLSTDREGITLKVTNGRLRQDPVLTKVLKILNLPAVLLGKVDFGHGIPFHSLSARVVAKNGVFTSKDIVLDSPILRVTGAGAADVKDNGLDLALAVSPVAAYADVIGKIPLFDRLFGGDHSGITTAMFQAKGSLRDPAVAYLPLESLGRGLAGYPRLALDVLMNTIQLPRTAIAYATE